eukprot:8526855-Pyramimonas_sp.AAC.1
MLHVQIVNQYLYGTAYGSDDSFSAIGTLYEREGYKPAVEVPCLVCGLRRRLKYPSFTRHGLRGTVSDCGGVL